MIEQSMIPKEWLENESYIYWASIFNHREALKELLKFGADVNKPKCVNLGGVEKKISPLHAAAEHGYTEIVKYFWSMEPM